MKSVRETIRQSAPFRSKSQQAQLGLFLTTDRVRTSLSRLLEPHDLTPQQYNVLRILRGAEPEGLPTLAVASRMIEKAPGITKMIDRLEAKRLVGRERRGEDRRCVHCRITGRGLELLARLDEAVDRFDLETFKALSSKELNQLVDMLDRVRLSSER